MPTSGHAVYGLLLVAQLLTGSAAGALSDNTLTVGYSAKLFFDVDINDAQAATRVWTKRFLERIGRQEGSETLVFDDIGAVVQGVRDSRIDLLVLLPTEYLALRDKVDLKPMLIPDSDGDPGYNLGLLCRADRGLELADLQGMDLLLAETGGQVPRLWLNSALRSAEQPSMEAYFQQVRVVQSVARAVLPVFFGQAGACVVRLNTYETMTELNPQLGRELKVILSSPLIPNSVICAPPVAYEEFGSALEQGMRSLHEDPEGRQILSIFGVDRLVPFQEQHLEALRTLLRNQRDSSGVTK